MSSWLVPTSGSIERDELERAYGALLAGDDAASGLERVRPVVRESWARSVERRVRAEGVPELELSGDALEAYRAGHPLSTTLSLIRALLLPGASDDAGVVVAVGDAAGRLLWIEGDRTLRARVSDMGFVEGANWSEERVGTAAPGTALALGRSVQVRGAEHFNRHVLPWSCTAAPVRDPETGRLLGVIDVTGGNEAASTPAQMLVDATARAVEGELLVARLREDPAGKRVSARVPSTPCATLSVLGRDRALLTVPSSGAEHSIELGLRHAEIVLMLATYRQGLTAERLAELVYGDPAAVTTLRPEMVRLRRLLAASAPGLVPESRPYRIPAVETDAQQILALLDRGAHRVALAAFRGDALPDSVAPGVEELRERVRTSLRETLLGEAGADVLLSYLDTDVGADDADAMRQVLRMLPPRSPRRAGLVARLENLDRDA